MNTETPAPAAPEQHHALAAKYRHLDWMANQITAAVEAAPMTFIADGGERAHRLANRLHEQAQREELQRANALLVTLEDAIKTIHNHATAETAHARLIGDAHAGDYNEGRAKGCSEVLTAVQAAKSALYGIGRGNTRQENAAAFAETIITGTPPRGTDAEGFAAYCNTCGRSNGTHSYHCHNDR